MGEPYIGEIRMFAGNFAPVNWMFCQGQSLSISDYQALFQLLGTTYGGDGQTIFNLPDLRSRLPIHQGPDGQGNNYTVGQTGGAEAVTINNNTLAIHGHAVNVNGNANSGASPSGSNALFGATQGFSLYGPGSSPTAMSPRAVSPSYTSSPQPHSNIKPYLCINYIISLSGIFPSQS